MYGYSVPVSRDAADRVRPRPLADLHGELPLVMYPYAEFLIDFERRHGDLVHENRPENTCAAVIVETRPLFFLPKVIRNVMYFLGPGWNLYVWCGPLNRDFLHESLPGWGMGLRTVPAQPWRISVNAYNGLLMSPVFWRDFTEEKVLVFQADSLLADGGIERFLGYDLVGAPCRSLDEQYIANGGLSLRSRELMVACTTRFRPAPAEPEDMFFTRRARRLGAALPDFTTACRFSVESHYVGHPVGVHGTDKFFHGVDVAKKITAAIKY